VLAVLAKRRRGELLTEDLGEGLLGLDAGVGGVHLGVRDHVLGLHLGGDVVTSGHDVGVVDVADEGLDLGALLNLLLAHLGGDAKGGALDTGDEAVTYKNSFLKFLWSIAFIQKVIK
jgi:hypothetical protein